MLLYDLENDQDFQYLTSRLLVSSPASGSDQGGLFLIDFKTNTLEKLYSGSCSGMTRVNDRLYITSDDNQIITMDQRFQVIRKTNYGKLDFHGIATFNEHVVLIVETATNTIGCYETDNLTRIGAIRFGSFDKDVHHLNDIWLANNTLYVSMFSPYGEWYRTPMDKNGAILKIDLADFQPTQHLDIDPTHHVIVNGLYMPHTVIRHNERLAYCDSMAYRVEIEKNAPIQLQGFTRGLAMTDDTIFIGQSRMRHVLRIPHAFSNCCLDGGIHVYNSTYRISRFVSLPAQQVYQILVLDQDFSLERGN